MHSNIEKVWPGLRKIIPFDAQILITRPIRALLAASKDRKSLEDASEKLTDLDLSSIGIFIVF